MTTRKPPEDTPAERREKRKTIAFLVLMMAGGLILAVSAIAYRRHLSEKADRLRGEGRPVPATVSGFYAGSGRGSGADWVEVTYSVEGRSYRGRVKCGGGTGCVNAPGPEVTVLVDPERPEEFLLKGGNVTGSLFFLNSWALIPTGLIVAIGGGALLSAGPLVARYYRSTSPQGEATRPQRPTPGKRKHKRKHKRKGRPA